ncbi:MAG: cardiolipin synthase [Planctomycetaceae bacterium]|nr:cardiolipin synthase [Planctomycetaceae bacterium]
MIYGFVAIILSLNLLFVITVIFFERKTPQASMAWILLLTFVPIFGFFLYLLFGSGFRLWKRKRYVRKSKNDASYEYEILRRLEARNQHLFASAKESRIRLLQYLENECDGCYTNDNHVEVFTGGEDFFSRLLNDIRTAEKHIHVLFYIIKNDCTGRELVDALRERAKAGVEVRLIYDGVGSLFSFGSLFRELKRAGGQVRAFSPVFGKINSSLLINYRNHRKIVVIDGNIGYVGGMNVGDEYRNRHPRLVPWRDTHVRITGSAVWFLQERFLLDWCHVTDYDLRQTEDLIRYFPEAIRQGHLGVQVASSGPDTDDNPIKGGLLRMFYGARKTLYIQTPYIAVDQSILDAFKVAVKTGVDVRLMIPRLADHRLVHMSTLGYAQQILESGVRVFLYHGFLHAKTAVADGSVATLGTTNLSNRSFTQNFEVNIFVHSDDFAQEQENLFLEDQANCTELTEEWFRSCPLLSRFWYNAARLLSPLI